MSSSVWRCAMEFRAVLISSIVVTLLGSFSETARGQTPNDIDERFAEHLAAGEFSVALGFARANANQTVRDQMFAQIAAAQAQAGARRASVGSLAEVSSDQIRSSTAEQIRSAPVSGLSARGGAALADFTTLIDLITTTIAPDTWDLVGGPGAVQEFPGGVLVDSSGTLKRIKVAPTGLPLGDLRDSAVRPADGPRDVRRKSPLRKVSLTRLEKQLQMKWALGESPDETMRALAGLRRVQYVFVYPETGDIVLAGPAGDWREDQEGRLVGVDDGHPVLRLDDLIVLLRQAFGKEQQFGCSITPRTENLARTKEFLDRWAGKPLRPGQRDQWLGELRDQLGEQDIEVFGVDPRTRVAHVMVEADYRMKLVGMGLEEGTLGVQSYLDSLIAAGRDASDMTMLRWWFTLNESAIHTTKERNAFSFDGKTVKVLSENELVTQQGSRVQTGKSDEFAARFAANFTKHLDKLTEKYPVYAELRNVFDLALAAALIRAEDLPGQVDWQMTYLLDPQRCPVALNTPPQQVQTVVSHRMVDQKRFIAGVSGGVTVRPSTLVSRDSIKLDTYGLMPAEHTGSMPKKLPRDAWWWD